MSTNHSPADGLLRVIALAIALASGVVLFIQYFFPSPGLDRVAQPLLQWVVLLTAAALLFAATNLLQRHMRSLADNPLSRLLILGFVLMFVAGLLPQGFRGGAGRWLYESLLAPGLAALFALLPIFLAYALVRHLNVRDFGGALLAITLLLVLLGQTPLLIERLPLLAAIRHDIIIGPAAAAFRGVLIGLALGVILSVFARLRLE